MCCLWLSTFLCSCSSVLRPCRTGLSDLGCLHPSGATMVTSTWEFHVGSHPAMASGQEDQEPCQVEEQYHMQSKAWSTSWSVHQHWFWRYFYCFNWDLNNLMLSLEYLHQFGQLVFCLKTQLTIFEDLEETLVPQCAGAHAVSSPFEMS